MFDPHKLGSMYYSRRCCKDSSTYSNLSEGPFIPRGEG
jgi:hypothetical protein